MPEEVVVGRGQPLHQAFDHVDVLLRLVTGGGLRPGRVVLGQEHAVRQRPQQVLEQGGRDEDGDLGPVDLLPLVQPLPQVSHHADVGAPPEDPDGFWSFLVKLDQHRADGGGKLCSSVSSAQIGKGSAKQTPNLQFA